MKELPLTQGYVAVVDDHDFPFVSAFKWHAMKTGPKRGVYAGREVRKDGRRTTLYLHQAIISTLFRVDHRDGDGLNNRRENLRPATSTQNARGFRRKSKNASSQFRGVHWCKTCSKWMAQIMVNKANLPLGRFDSEQDAARAYDVAARQHFGEFASPNFPL